MKMSDLDIVEATRRCADRLTASGLLDWGQKLRSAIDQASTGGELVMGVRWILQSLQRSGATLPDDVADLVLEIVKAIDDTGW